MRTYSSWASSSISNVAVSAQCTFDPRRLIPETQYSSPDAASKWVAADSTSLGAHQCSAAVVDAQCGLGECHPTDAGANPIDKAVLVLDVRDTPTFPSTELVRFHRLPSIWLLSCGRIRKRRTHQQAGRRRRSRGMSPQARGGPLPVATWSGRQLRQHLGRHSSARQGRSESRADADARATRRCAPASDSRKALHRNRIARRRS